MTDKRNLLQRPGRQSWYAVVEVPRAAQADLGRRRMKTLKTASLKEAQRRRGPVVSALWAQIERERRQLGHTTTERDRVLAEAREVADEWRHSTDPDHRDVIPDAIEQRAEEINRVHDADLASKYTAVANDAFTTLSDKIEDWLAEASMIRKTKVEYRGAVNEFLCWNNGEAFSEKVTRRLAGRYVTEHLQNRALQPAAINRKVSALSSFWRWLERRGLASANVWTGQGVAKRANQRGGTKQHEAEREFTDGEVAKLLRSAPDTTMYDFLRVLLLTGMRREEPAQLRVRDVQDGIFHVRDGKNTSALRTVPIHPDLSELVERRTADKDADSFLLHELRENDKGRSDVIGKRFTRYRRGIGVTEEGPGHRDAINLHSTRRWFETTAEKAGQPPWIIEAVCGQSRSGMFGRYSGGPSEEQKKACVEAVKLPEH